MAGSPFYLREDKSFYDPFSADSSPPCERTVAKNGSYIYRQKDVNGLRSILAKFLEECSRLAPWYYQVESDSKYPAKDDGRLPKFSTLIGLPPELSDAFLLDCGLLFEYGKQREMRGRAE